MRLNRLHVFLKVALSNLNLPSFKKIVAERATEVSRECKWMLFATVKLGLEMRRGVTLLSNQGTICRMEWGNL